MKFEILDGDVVAVSPEQMRAYMEMKMNNQKPDQPVEQPAGQAVAGWKLFPPKLTPKMADVLEFGRTQPVHNTYLNLWHAAPHSPVAQMSGDESFHTWASQNGYPMARDKAGNYLWDSTKAARKIWQAASHPSNAVQDAPKPVAWLAEQWSPPNIAGEPNWITVATTSEPTGWVGFRNVRPCYAAPVPQVVQAPEGWKLVPIEPSAEMLLAYRAFIERREYFKDLSIYKAIIDAAPQPIAASPSIVPSDERIIAVLHKVHAAIVGDETMTALDFVTEAIELLTTTSNAGEAAPAAIDVRDAALEEAYQACGKVSSLAHTDSQTAFECMDAIRALQSPPQTGNAGEAVQGGEA